MIFAFDTCGVLRLYESETFVIKDIEAIDIENHEYEFCDHYGRKISAEITKPITRMRGGDFKLNYSNSIDPLLPMQFLDKAKELGNTCLGISTLNELREFLAEQQWK